MALALALAERVVAFFCRRAGAVTLDRAGLTLRRRGRQVLVPWDQAEVVRAPQGLFVAVPGGACGLVASRLPNFWAAAPVIETRARLGPHSAPVHFRVRVAGGALAVVGEIEPAA
jgi:DNA-binding transcriptional LysR family regulator